MNRRELLRRRARLGAVVAPAIILARLAMSPRGVLELVQAAGDVMEEAVKAARGETPRQMCSGPGGCQSCPTPAECRRLRESLGLEQ